MKIIMVMAVLAFSAPAEVTSNIQEVATKPVKSSWMSSNSAKSITDCFSRKSPQPPYIAGDDSNNRELAVVAFGVGVSLTMHYSFTKQPDGRTLVERRGWGAGDKAMRKCSTEGSPDT